ncbi:hypothetical protein AB0442_36100 [Kitasatospora sp. NPDC085895]|uniref:arsenate reductase/protein-tyrosine-phosphatase family protein n=1 Tax=Kitasatospora sp. NPDC085895 TaxID=3155057 RepID=UPI00344E9648
MTTFRLRYVCTANLCRSPLAERITELRMPPAAGWSWLAVTSAGTHGQDGLPMHLPAAELLTGIGADPAGFTSRRLTAAMVAGDDLVLTAELAHRDAVIALCPAASRRTFLVREFARLVRHPPVTAGLHAPQAADGSAAEQAARARELVAAAARFRGRMPWQEPALDEIADPDGTEAMLIACAKDIDRVVTQIVTALLGPAPQPATVPVQTIIPIDGKGPRP